MKINKFKKIITIFLFSTLIVGCGNQAEEINKDAEASETEVVETAGLEEQTELEEPEPVLEEFDITLGFAGDICFDDNELPVQHYNAIGATDISEVIRGGYAEAMQDMDLMWINNEFTYSTRGTPLAGKMYTFRSDPSHVSWLTDLGVDIVGLANNHVYDYGADAFEDTLSTLEIEGIPYVGAGRTLDEAKAPVYLETNGLTVAYVAASRAEKFQMTPQATDTEGGILRCYDNTLFLESIQEARENADIVIALPHWGTEGSTVLEDAQTDGAALYLQAGADAVIGAHPHILQGVDLIDGKPVVYSLGNFWFDYRDESTMIAVLHVTGTRIDGEIDRDSLQVALQILPGTQRDQETFLQTEPAEQDRIFREIESYSDAISIDEDGYVTKVED